MSRQPPVERNSGEPFIAIHRADALPRPQHGGRCLSGVAACLMLGITAPEKILPLDTFSSCTQIKVGTKTIIVNEIIGKLWDSEFSGQSYPMSVRKLGILPPTGFR